MLCIYFSVISTKHAQRENYSNTFAQEEKTRREKNWESTHTKLLKNQLRDAVEKIMPEI